MARYYPAFQLDLGFYPNYSLALGDITGDGRLEVVALSTDGNLLRVLDLDGRVVLEHGLKNYGTWGTIHAVCLDVTGDGRMEIVVPDGPAGKADLIALDVQGQVVREARLPAVGGDDYGVAIPMLDTYRRDMDGESLGLCVGLAGGIVLALDTDFEPLWQLDGLRAQYGHESWVHDVTGDGLDDIVFVSVDRINRFEPVVEGELVILRGIDGEVLLRKRVRDLVDDTHFDDVVIADLRGNGQKEILVEKGILMSLQGEVIWDISDQLEHGQWIATAPNPHGPGLVAFIAELWSNRGRSKLVAPTGQVLWELTPDRITRLHPERLPGASILPTRAHAIDWFGDGRYEIALGEQISLPSGHACYEGCQLPLKLRFHDLEGRSAGEMQFLNACREGFWYNGEVRSRVADVDGDGYPEWVFPTQGGIVLVIKKEP